MPQIAVTQTTTPKLLITRGPCRSASRPKSGEINPPVSPPRLTASAIELRLQLVVSSIAGSIEPVKICEVTAPKKEIATVAQRTHQP